MPPKSSASPAIALIGGGAMPRPAATMLGDVLPVDAMTVEIESEIPSGVVENDDGSVSFLDLDEDGPGEMDAGEHWQNLAEVLDEQEIMKLIDKVEKDKEAWDKASEMYKQAIERTGIGGAEAPGGATFNGASKVTHPIVAEGAIDYAASMCRELLPAEGPVRSKIIGTETADKVARGDRLARLMNDQLTRQSPEFRHDLEQLFTQQPLSGQCYLKAWWVHDENRPTCEFIANDDLILPAAATNYWTAPRRTHVLRLTQEQLLERMEDGMYRELDIPPASMSPDQTAAAEATDKISGVNKTGENIDDVRIVYEVYVKQAIEGDPLCEGKRGRYIITIDEQTKKVLSLRRNWMPGDEARKEINWITPWGMIPWRGARCIGVYDLITGLSSAATGALRALLDSAQIENFPGMIKLKGAMNGGSSSSIDPTQVTEIDAGAGVDDIRKVAMPIPFRGPSATLFQLLQWLTDAAKGIVRTSMDDIPADQVNANTPVGTQLSRVEQGLKVFSSIHSRQHESMRALLEHLYTLNKLYYSEEEAIEDTGEPLATRADFEGPCDVAPVSDPAIFSDLQRLSQAQALKQLQTQSTPGLIDERAVNKKLMQAMKIADIDTVMPPEKKPYPMNPAAENVAMMMGQPAFAFPEQDHLSHLSVHLDCLHALIMQPLMAPRALNAEMHHIGDHLALWYGMTMKQLVESASGVDLDEDDPTPKAQIALAQTLAAASPQALQALSGPMQQFAPVIAQALQMQQQMSAAAQPPADPAVKAQMAEVERRKQADQVKARIDQEKIDNAMQIAQMKASADAAKSHERGQVDLEMNAQDNETALAIAASHPREVNGNGLTNPGV